MIPYSSRKSGERFGRTYSVPNTETKARRKKIEATTVARLLVELPAEVILDAIEGLTWWYSNWAKHLTKTLLFAVWRKLWLEAVKATNRRDENADVEVTFDSAEPDETRKIDTLNNPAGRMVGEFLNNCPPIRGHANPFTPGRPLTVIRNQIIRAPGRSRLIAIHRLLEGLPYFLRADPRWTKVHLLAPLRADTEMRWFFGMR